MKSIKETIKEAIDKTINEARQGEYRAEFIGSRGGDGTPITVTIIVDRADIKGFEKFLEDEEGNVFTHAEGGNVEY